jgi:hypothetical protein
MPWVALLDSLQLCRISWCLYTPFVQDQHFSTTSSLIVLTTTKDLFMQCAPQDLAGYPQILDIVDLSPI